MKQNKLEVVKQQMAKMNINILGFCELERKGMGEFNSDDHYIYYCGKESLKRNGVAFMVNKSVQNAVLSYNLKNERMILVHFQGKPFNLTVVQIYATITNAEEAEVDWFDQSRLSGVNTKKKRCPFHHRGLECKSRKSRAIWSNRQV